MAGDFVEHLWVELNLGRDGVMLLGVIYRSPNSNRINNESLLRLLRVAAERNCSRWCVMGDFNLPRVDWGNEGGLVGLRGYELSFLRG